MAISIKIVDNECIFIVNEQLIQSKTAIIINIGNMKHSRYSHIWEYGLINHNHGSSEYFDLQRFVEDGVMTFNIKNISFYENNVINIISTFSRDDICKMQNCLKKLIKYRSVL